MARPRKARTEGATARKPRKPEAPPIAADENEHGVEVVEITLEKAKALLAGLGGPSAMTVDEAKATLADANAQQEAAGTFKNPVPGDDGDALDRIAASFRERFPDEWDGLALCPLKHGIAEMANLMRGKG